MTPKSKITDRETLDQIEHKGWLRFLKSCPPDQVESQTKAASIAHKQGFKLGVRAERKAR